MKKTTRRILALALSLALVCALAVVGSAQYLASVPANPTTIDTLRLTPGLGIKNYSVEAYVGVKTVDPDELRHCTVEIDVGMNYTYCPENAFRPSNYRTGSSSGTASYLGNNNSSSTETSTRVVFSSGNIQFGSYGYCLVLNASANMVIDVTTRHTTAEHTPDPMAVEYDY